MEVVPSRSAWAKGGGAHEVNGKLGMREKMVTGDKGEGLVEYI